MKSIAEYRKAGYKLRIRHLRVYRDKYTIPSLKHKSDIEEGDILSYKGGETQIELTTPEGKSYFGISKCLSDFYYDDKKEGFISRKGDPFNRKLGIRIALGRIVKQMEKDNAKLHP